MVISKCYIFLPYSQIGVWIGYIWVFLNFPLMGFFSALFSLFRTYWGYNQLSLLLLQFVLGWPPFWLKMTTTSESRESSLLFETPLNQVCKLRTTKYKLPRTGEREDTPVIGTAADSMTSPPQLNCATASCRHILLNNINKWYKTKHEIQSSRVSTNLREFAQRVTMGTSNILTSRFPWPRTLTNHIGVSEGEPKALPFYRPDTARVLSIG